MAETNTTYWRSARIYVLASRAWLTNDGEYQDGTEGWKELEKELRENIQSCHLPYPEIKIEFDEWDSEPQIVE